MLKIDNSLLQDIGLGGLPDDEKNSLLKHIYETLEMRVGMRLADQMTNEQLDEFEQYFEAKDDAGAFKWLETNFPNYKDIVQEEFDKLKSEVAQSAPQILGASQQQQVAPASVPSDSSYQQQPAAVMPQAQPQQPEQAWSPAPIETTPAPTPSFSDQQQPTTLADQPTPLAPPVPTPQAMPVDPPQQPQWSQPTAPAPDPYQQPQSQPQQTEQPQVAPPLPPQQQPLPQQQPYQFPQQQPPAGPGFQTPPQPGQ
jgi:hypothetical protein